MTRPLPRLTIAQAKGLTLDTEPWLSCETCFDLMDRYVDGLLGLVPHEEVPGLERHLAGCAACAEEVASLQELARDTRGDGQAR